MRNGESTVGAVVQGAFHPLSRDRHRGTRLEAHDESRERADAFATHGVAFIGHGARTDLVLFKGFFQLFLMSEDAQVGREFVSALGDAREGVENLSVEFARIGLTGDGERLVESDFFADFLFELSDFRVVAVEELEETRLGAGSSLVPEGLEAFETIFEVF